MKPQTTKERADQVKKMFARIAPRYDLMNRLMTAGQDVRWRRQVIQLARLTPSASLLDLGTGTGDLAREALRQQPEARVTAADFTLDMLRVGRKYAPLALSAADALDLPFADNTFDAVVSGFLMRNVTDLDQALKEQHRALKPGGRIVILDTTRPKRSLLSPFIWIHLHMIIPTLGTVITGNRQAYQYLPQTTENFLTAEDLAKQMSTAGFKNVGFQRLMFGTIAIHWGEK